MSISYDEAIATLKVMFPDWEEETLSTILISNQYHVERTIESVLAMSGDQEIIQAQQQRQQQIEQHQRQAPPTPQQRTTSPQRSNESAARQPPRRESRSAAASNRPMAAPASDPNYRGRKCTLPADFLRPPGYEYRAFADEELALMLQNELFQREVRAMFGDDFVRQVNSQNGRQTTGQRPTPGRQPSGAAPRPSVTNTSTPADQSQGEADLGIMKALSSMGGAARRNLSMLAQRFSTQQQTRNGETGTAREFKPLVDNNGEDDDEVEFVSFNSGDNRSRHVMQDVAETGDSENPLIQQYSSQTGTRTASRDL